MPIASKALRLKPLTAQISLIKHMGDFVNYTTWCSTVEVNEVCFISFYRLFIVKDRIISELACRGPYGEFNKMKITSYM